MIITQMNVHNVKKTLTQLQTILITTIEQTHHIYLMGVYDKYLKQPVIRNANPINILLPLQLSTMSYKPICAQDNSPQLIF